MAFANETTLLIKKFMLQVSRQRVKLLFKNNIPQINIYVNPIKLLVSMQHL